MSTIPSCVLLLMSVPLLPADMQGVPAMRTVAAHVLPVPAPVSPATSGSHQHSSLCDASATAVAPLLAASRAASPEPDWRDEEAVRLAGLALQLSQVGGCQGVGRLQADPGGGQVAGGRRLALGAGGWCTRSGGYAQAGKEATQTPAPSTFPTCCRATRARP